MHSRSNKVQMEIGRNDPKNTKMSKIPPQAEKKWGICFYTVDLDPPGGVGGSPETLGK